MSERHRIEWDAENQSPDELATALFERMVADGAPASVAAEASEQIKQKVINLVAQERLRDTCQLLARRLRPLTTMTWALCGIVIGQAIAIMVLNGWNLLIAICEGMALIFAAYVLVRIMLDAVQTSSGSRDDR